MWRKKIGTEGSQHQWVEINLALCLLRLSKGLERMVSNNRGVQRSLGRVVSNICAKNSSLGRVVPNIVGAPRSLGRTVPNLFLDKTSSERTVVHVVLLRSTRFSCFVTFYLDFICCYVLHGSHILLRSTWFSYFVVSSTYVSRGGMSSRCISYQKETGLNLLERPNLVE